MTRTRSLEVFDSAVKELFLQLRAWSGESLGAETQDADARRAAQSRVDTGRMASLRRGIAGNGQPIASVAWAIEPCIPQDWSTDSAEYLALYQSALLYARHPHSEYLSTEKRRGTPITRTFLKAHGGNRGADEETRAHDRRVNFLLDATAPEIFERLRRVLVPLMGKSDLPVDWLQLARDLRDWDDTGQPVQMRWARAWFGAPAFLRAEGVSSEQAAPEPGERDHPQPTLV